MSVTITRKLFAGTASATCGIAHHEQYEVTVWNNEGGDGTTWQSVEDATGCAHCAALEASRMAGTRARMACEAELAAHPAQDDGLPATALALLG